MKIYSILLLVFTLLLCSLPVRGDSYKYVNGNNSFEITETATSYEVVCDRESTVTNSRNKNILDRQLRLDAIDVIGAYVLFKSEATLPSSFFKIYVEGINLHYNAYVEGIKQETRIIDGKACVCYSCDKEKYHIESATYNKDFDISSAIQSHYDHNKGEEAASLIYNYDKFTSSQYLMLERDFLTGNAKMPDGIRVLQSITDRFENSVYSFDNQLQEEALNKIKTNIPQTNPYKQFVLEEYVTGAPLKTKDDGYKDWKKCLNNTNCIWEDFLLFCSNNTSSSVPKGRTPSFSDVIQQYPGALSPFGIRKPINDDSYNEAVKSYSNNDFQEASQLLRESIDNEGISPQTLNLLGASYRFLNKPDMAIPFLLLCYKLNPGTQYVAGNIAICASELNYPKVKELCTFLLSSAVDDWSKNEISILLNK